MAKKKNVDIWENQIYSTFVLIMNSDEIGNKSLAIFRLLAMLEAYEEIDN